MGVVNNMNAAQAGYDKDYANSMQQGKTNRDAGLQMGLSGLGTLSNPLGSSGSAMQGYTNLGSVGAAAGQAGQNSLSQALTNPKVQDAAKAGMGWLGKTVGNYLGNRGSSGGQGSLAAGGFGGGGGGRIRQFEQQGPM